MGVFQGSTGELSISPGFQVGNTLLSMHSGSNIAFDHMFSTPQATVLRFIVNDPEHEDHYAIAPWERVQGLAQQLIDYLGRTASREAFAAYDSGEI